MRNNALPEAEKYAKLHKRRRVWHKVVGCLACMVVFITTYMLILPAITMEKTAYCGQEEHTHSDACYETRLVCGKEETTETPHTHTDECYEEHKVLVCGKEESAGHVHDENCVQRDTVLVCTDESEEHEHTDECYQTTESYVCGKSEGEGAHTHTDECYDTERVLICDKEESAVTPHTHTDACYEKVMVCKKKEHTHQLSCYSNSSADVESASVWERSLSGVKLTGIWADDVISVAESQIGYKESKKNYIVTEDGKTKGYTRYGDWYGNAYGDWCAMFVSFCLNYADIPQSAIPYEASCQRWIKATSGSLYYSASDYTPQKGDLIFFDWDNDGHSDHVGLVASVSEDGSSLQTIEGNSSSAVRTERYNTGDKDIMGYAALPENPAMAADAADENTGEAALDENAENDMAADMAGTYALMTLAEGEDETENTGEDTIAVMSESTGELPVTSISGTDVTFDKNTNTYKADVNIQFVFPANTTITAGTIYTYTYPDGVIVPPGELNVSKTLLDNSKRNAGTYTFVQNEDGSYSVQIVFNTDYVTNYCNKGEAVTGFVNFEGELSGSKVQEDGSIVIGDGNLQINVPAGEITYPDEETNEYNISATKHGEWKKSDNELIYTVYIRTTKGTPEPIEFTDTITIPEGLELGSPTVEVQKGITYYYSGWYNDVTLEPVTNVTHSYNPETGELAMTLEGLEKTEPEGVDYYQAEFYKITYTYPITAENWTGNIEPGNTVVVSSTDETKNQTVKSEASTKLYLSKDTSYTLDKYGEENGDRIKWTITVNKNQVDIAGATLSDEMLTSAEGLEVTPANGYSLDETQGVITFKAIDDGKNTNQYTIVYYTPVENTDYNGNTVKNEATFDPTPSEPDNGDKKNVEYTVTVSGVGLNKWGQYDQSTGKINWTINVNSNNKDIAGAILTDSIFAGLEENDISISPTSNYEFVKNDGKITGIKFTADSSGLNNQQYTITYSVVPETPNPGEETTISNTAGLSPGEGGNGPEKTSEVTVYPITVSKSGYYTDSKINWTVTVNANHRDIAGYELTDTLFADLKVSDIKITNNNWGGEVPEGEYSIEHGTDGYVTKIVFNALADTGVNTNQYYLSYTTTAEPEWNDKTYKNDVHLKKGEIDIPASAEVNVPGIKKVEKNADSLVSSDDGKTGTITWTVTIDVPATGLPAGVVVTDDVTKNNYGNTNKLQWMTWEQINSNNFMIYWKDANGTTISTSNPYDDHGNPVFELKFLASDGNEYDFKTIKENESDKFRNMTYTLLTMTFTNGLTLPEDITAVPTQITFSYSTTVDLEHSDIGTSHFYNSVDVDGEKADDYIDYEKAGVVKTDGNGNEEQSQTTSDGELIWKVKVKTVGNDLTKLTVTDTLPAGVLPKTIFVQGDGMSNINLTVSTDNTISGDGSPYHYSGTFDPETRELVLEVTNQTEGSALLENQEWNFTFTCDADDAVLPPGETYNLTNSVTVTTDKGSVGSDSQTQDWTHTESTEETKVVQKSGEWDNSNRLLNYSIVLNPQGKDLVEGVETLTLVDTLKYKSANIGANWYAGTDGATFTIKADLVQNSVRLFKAVLQNGKWVKSEEITDFGWVYKTEKADDWDKTVTNTLNVSGIPDECPLIFEYAYSVSSSAENHPNEEQIKFNLPFSNEAKLEGTEHSGSSSSSSEEWSHSSSSAGVTTGHHTYTFYKVVKDNYNNALPGAVFSVYEYSKTEGKWLSEAIHTYTTDAEGKFVITFEDTNEAGEQIYKYNTVYGISETMAPEGYIKPDGYNPRYFYFSNSEADDNLPDTIQSGAIDLSSESATAYVENTPNETEITVEKKWLDENGNDETASHSGDEIKLELYQRVGSESNASGNLTLTIDVKAGNNGNDSWWNDVKTNIAAGSTVTFSVTNNYGNTSPGYNHITIEGAEYTTTQEINGYVVTDIYTLTMSQNVTIAGYIKWNTNEISHTEATVTPPKNSSSGNGETEENESKKIADVTLKGGNNWTDTVSGLPVQNTAIDGTTETYYYYFKEVDVPEGYSVSYSDNQAGVQSGTVTVTNRKNKDNISVTVNKVWKNVNGEDVDVGSEILPDSIQVYLTRTVGETTERVDSDGNTGDTAQPYSVTKESGWSLSIDNLPRTDSDGNIYSYSFEEVPVEGYETTVSKTGQNTIIITNQKQPADTDLTVEKIWQDKDGNLIAHNDGNVTINLYQRASRSGSAGGGEIGYIFKGDRGYENPILGTFEGVSVGDRLKIILEMKYSGNSWMNITWEGVSDGYGTWNGNTYEYLCTVTHSTISIKVNDTINCLKGNGISYNIIESNSIVNESEDEGKNASASAVVCYKTIILNKDNHWKYTFGDLPLTDTDEDGNTITYYYYIEEVSVPNYTSSYENNGGIQSGTIIVTNQATDTPEYELPETGGPGTKLYTIGGMLLMACSGFLLMYNKKRRKEDMASS